ncbi:glycosyltransferase family 87 protein [Naumannella huperziae]
MTRAPGRWRWLLWPLPLIAGAYEASRADGASWTPWRGAMVDLQAIIGASGRLLSGEDLYGGGGVPFSMPPAMALFGIPFAIAGPEAAQLLWVLITAGLVAALLVAPLLAYRSPALARSAWVPLLAALLITLAVPIRDNFRLGQVTVLITCLLIADLVRPRPGPRLPRGVLTGIAAALAVFPVVVVILQLASPRHRRAGLFGATTAIGITLLAWLAAPISSLRYWSATLAGRHLAEGNAYERETNGSLPAVLARGLGEQPTTTVLGTVLALVVLAAALAAGLALCRSGRHLAGMLTAGLGGVVIMPLAFPQAWVIALPLAAIMLVRRGPWLWQLTAAVLGLWACVQPASRVGGELVAAGSLLLTLAWFAVVIAGAAAQRAGMPR